MPYANKVQAADGTVWIDLTSDTVEANKLLAGYTAHGADGAAVTGTHHCYIEPIVYDYLPGYVSGSQFVYQNSTNNHSDIYEVEVGETYVVVYGATRGTRFRSVTLDVNPAGTGRTHSGTQITNETNPIAYKAALFTADRPYYVITKDNASVAGLHTTLIKVTGVDLT